MKNLKRREGDYTQVHRPSRLSEVIGNAEAKSIIGWASNNYI
jgi:hypothetical protein